VSDAFHKTSPADETAEQDAKTFQLDAWFSGVTPTFRSCTLYQRADLMARVDELTTRLRLAEAMPQEDRQLSDESPAAIRREIEELAEEFEASAITFKVQGRSDAYRDGLKKKLKKQGIEEDAQVGLHILADAIVEPRGVTVEHLQRLADVSEAQLSILFRAVALASTEAPRVDVPFSSGSSSSRGGRR